jgi:phosphoribosylaminoimidazole-succinocarboxamide synthase
LTVLTPDSSRFWPKDKWEEALKLNITPPSFDKQPVRNAGKKAGVKKNPEWVPSSSLIKKTTANYRKVLKLLTGIGLEKFWSDVMGIRKY